MAEDLYATLGVPKDADAATIKKTYRKLARDLHPDKNPGNKASEARFKAVNHAYDIIGDASVEQPDAPAVRPRPAGVALPGGVQVRRPQTVQPRAVSPGGAPMASQPAGAAPDVSISPGTAVRIMTGAPMPVGATDS